MNPIIPTLEIVAIDEVNNINYASPLSNSNMLLWIRIVDETDYIAVKGFI